MDTVIPVDKSPHDVPILVYHKIDPRFEYSITRVAPTRFARHLDWLVSLGYTTVRLSEIIHLANTGAPVPTPSVALVFDDGFDSVFEYALPLLRKRGMTASVFPVVGYTGREDAWDVNIGWRRFRHLTWDQLRRLRDAGFEIGSHTLNHPDLTRLPTECIRYELETSRQILQDQLGTTVHMLSCPFGKYSTRIARLSIDAGYTGILVVRNRYDRTGYKNGIVTLPGMCVYRTTRFKSLQARLERRNPSWLMRAVDRGIGWCAGWTPRVKGPPSYPETAP